MDDDPGEGEGGLSRRASVTGVLAQDKLVWLPVLHKARVSPSELRLQTGKKVTIFMLEKTTDVFVLLKTLPDGYLLHALRESVLYGRLSFVVAAHSIYGVGEVLVGEEYAACHRRVVREA